MLVENTFGSEHNIRKVIHSFALSFSFSILQEPLRLVETKLKGRNLELQDYLSLIEFEKYPSRRAFTKTQLNTI